MLMLDDDEFFECTTGTGGDKLEEDLELFELSGSLSLQDDDKIIDLCKEEEIEQKPDIKSLLSTQSSNNILPDSSSLHSQPHIPHPPPPKQHKDDTDESSQSISQSDEVPYHDYSYQYSYRELKRRPHECSICHKRFIRKNHLNTHLMIHTGERNHLCHVCGKRFRQLSHLRSHVQLHSIDEREKAMKNKAVSSALPSTSDGENNGLSYKEILLKQVAYNELKRIERDLKPRPYECHVCHKRFIRRNHLTTHLMIHSGERKHLCSICGRLFRQLSHLKTHSLMHCTEKQFGCVMCEKKFVSSGALKRHQVIHLNDFKCHCHICGKGFHQTNHLSGHYQVHFSKSDLPNGTSIARFSTEEGGNIVSNLDVNSSYSNGRSNFPRQTFNSGLFNNKQPPIDFYPRARPYQCNQCSKFFTSRSSLSQHMLIHGDIRRYQCSSCGKRFRQKVHLTTHMLLHSGKRNFVCEVCGKSFFQKCTLIGHQLCHFGEKNHLCNICGKHFLRKNALNRHKRIHNREQTALPKKSDGFTEVFVPLSNQSSYSGQPDVNSDDLISENRVGDTNPLIKSEAMNEEVHLPDDSNAPVSSGFVDPVYNRVDSQFANSTYSNINSNSFFSEMSSTKLPTCSVALMSNGKRMFQCDQCLKCFSRKDAVKQHQLIHMDIRRFECSTCQRRFRQLSHLKSHELLHSNEKNYECFVCKKRFRMLSHLKNHSVVHMGIRKFQCPNCGNKFFRRSHLKRHFLIHLKKGESILDEHLNWSLANPIRTNDIEDNSASQESIAVKSEFTESATDHRDVQYEPVFPGFPNISSVKSEYPQE